MYEEMVLSTIYLPNNMRLITNKEKFTIVSKDFLLSMLDKRDMVTFLKTVAHMNLTIVEFLKMPFSIQEIKHLNLCNATYMPYSLKSIFPCL